MNQNDIRDALIRDHELKINICGEFMERASMTIQQMIGAIKDLNERVKQLEGEAQEEYREEVTE